MIICPNCKNILTKDSFKCDKCNLGPKVIDDIIIFHPELNNKCNDYDSSGLDVLFNIENKHFWFLQRKKVINYFFRKYILTTDKILEIGAGTGNVTRMLKDAGFSIHAGEIHLNGLKYAKSYGIKQCYQFDLLKIPFDGEFDTICMFDVLEHLDDENMALRNIAKALNENGKLILTVPSYNFLWSREDVKAYHKRRYTKKNLEQVLVRNGYGILKMKYFFASILPFLFIRKIINFDNGSFVKNEEHGNQIHQSLIINVLFNIILSLEFFFFKIFSLPFGGSIIVVARKL